MTNWMGVKEIADYMGVSKETIYRLLESKKIPCHRVRKIWKFDPSEVDKAIKRGVLK